MPSDPAAFLSADTVRASLERVRDRLGMEWLTTHRAGRHTVAQLLRDRGVPIEDIADVLGHASIETTRRHYAGRDASQIAATAAQAFNKEG